jgi:hypothetical protein
MDLATARRLMRTLHGLFRGVKKIRTAADPFWSSADYCLSAIYGIGTRDLSADAAQPIFSAGVYENVCRTDFDAPGFCLIDLGPDSSSQALREFMLRLKRGLAEVHRARPRRDLVFVSMGRFDQQVTTKLHRDGGPEESLLMLGYEPSEVTAEVALADYSKCAHELGLTPAEFLDQHNPMFGPGEELLRPYTTRVECFSNRSYQILLINNSIAPYSRDGSAWQGVLHTATIHNPAEQLRRVVNSTMLASVPLGEREPVSQAEQDEFLTTNFVRRRGYDKTHLDDDE